MDIPIEASMGNFWIKSFDFDFGILYYKNKFEKYIEEGIIEAKTECYAKDKVKSPLFFHSF